MSRLAARLTRRCQSRRSLSIVPSEMRPRRAEHEERWEADTIWTQSRIARREAPAHLFVGACGVPRLQREEEPSADAHVLLQSAWVKEALESEKLSPLWEIGSGPPPLKSPKLPPPGKKFRVTYIAAIDGVGWWRTRGVDPTAFSRAVAESVVVSVESAALARAPPPAPIEIMRQAHHRVNHLRVIGSATMCVAGWRPGQPRLTIANLGDSAAMLLRPSVWDTDTPKNWSIVFRTPPQQRSFNQPLQIGFAPDEEQYFDSPEDADLFVLNVRPGDILLVATDGLFENLHDDEIIEEVTAWSVAVSDPPDFVSGPDAAAKLAQTLTLRGRAQSVDKSRETPFSMFAKENDILWSGGIPDDITTAVGWFWPSSAT